MPDAVHLREESCGAFPWAYRKCKLLLSGVLPLGFTGVASTCGGKSMFASDCEPYCMLALKLNRIAVGLVVLESANPMR